MKPGKSAEIKEEIVEIHTAARSPSPKHKNSSRSRSRSRKYSNGHVNEIGTNETSATEPPDQPSKNKGNWVNTEQNESLEKELPIHDQIKQDILGFIQNEIKKSDNTKNPSFVFYSHDPNGLDDKFIKTLSRPSSGHREKRSPSYRKKKRHSSKHRDRDLHEFEIPGSSLSALEKVDDYLKEYNKDEVVTLSGELEYESNDVDNNNGSNKEFRHKSKKTRRKIKEDKQDANSNGQNDSPRIFKSGTKSLKSANKTARPTDLTSMLETLESNMPYHEQYIDNPFSSPSPLTSPNDERLSACGSRRPDKVYLQGGGTFRAVSRDHILGDNQKRSGEDKYLRLGNLTPLDVALLIQKAWKNMTPACHGILGGLSLMHLLLISSSDGLNAVHLSFHSVVTMPYVACYYFFCVLCLVSVLDRLDATSLDLTRGLQPYFQPIVLVILYTACLLVCTAARAYDELMVYQYPMEISNLTNTNNTMQIVPVFYNTWTHFSIWRAVLSILGLVYFVISNPQDLVYANLSKLLHFKPSLQSIG